MRHITLVAFAAASLAVFSQPLAAADEAAMLENCRSHAAQQLGKAADTIDVSLRGAGANGGYIVAGVVASSPIVTFQCSLDSAGTGIVGFSSAEHQGCPDQIAQQDRAKYPACN